MDREFALNHNIPLKKLLFPTLVIFIDVRPIASGGILEEFDALRVVFGDLACVIRFNKIHNPKHLVIIGLPRFELHNPEIRWINRVQSWSL